jgi:hypothetical protein
VRGIRDAASFGSTRLRQFFKHPTIACHPACRQELSDGDIEGDIEQMSLQVGDKSMAAV